MRSKLSHGLILSCVASVAVLLASAPLTAAADGVQDAAGKPSKTAEAKAAAKKSKSAKKQRFPKFEEVVKDMKPQSGLFTLYRHEPDDKRYDPEKLLCKIPAGLLNKDLLFATSISRGGQFTGWMWTDFLIHFEVAGKHVKIVVPDTRFIHQSGKPVTDAVKRTYTDKFIAAAPILTMSGSDPVIDLGPLLKSDLAGISFMGGSVRSDLSKWSKIKVFPENVLIDVELALMRGRTGTTVGVTYAFRKLPGKGSYKSRAADQRVGYFLSARQDWSRANDAREDFERYIHRWNLEKRDASLELSPPKKPITFIIEKTVPIRWRRWIRQGILDWNKAFEKIGYVDAIVVQQQTDDNEFANYDPEDARYNFFRWIVSGSAFAMGPSRADPRTGQILDADIIMDDSMVRVFMSKFDIFTPATPTELKGPGFRAWAREHRQLLPKRVAEALNPPVGSPAHMRETAHETLLANGQLVCTYADGLRRQLALAHYAMLGTASGKKIPERFIGEVIREVVTHEVGHTLGLRHNFKASSWLTLDEIKKRRDGGDEPTAASVMDYNPVLFFADDEPENVRHLITPTIGPYDYWAIEYGYGSPAKDKSEADWLKEVASRSSQRELAYATDEDTMWVLSPDPFVNRFDMSSEPMNWIRDRVKLCDRLLANITEWSVRDGEPRYHITRAFNALWFQRGINFEYAGRLIGGQYFNRDHAGDDARAPFELVDAKTQRAALELLSETLFNDEFFKVDPELLNSLAPTRWRHWGSSAPWRLDYPIHDRIAMLQWWTLFDITSPPVLQRIYDAELKSTDKDRFTAAELITTLRDHIWSHLDNATKDEYTDAKPFISSISRGLQREHLAIMLSAAQVGPGWTMSADLQGMIRYSLKELSDKIAALTGDAKIGAKAGAKVGGSVGSKGGGTVPDKDAGSVGGKARKLDFASRAHLSECKSRIDRVLEAEFDAR